MLLNHVTFFLKSVFNIYEWGNLFHPAPVVLTVQLTRGLDF